jgi:hypothetical protein
MKAYLEVEDDVNYDYVKLKIKIRSSVYLSIMSWIQRQTKDRIESLGLLCTVCMVYVVPAM